MKILCLIGAIFLFVAPVSADLAPISTESEKDSTNIAFAVEKYNLDNGLTVLLHVDNSLPIISYQTWLRVGSRNEEPGYTGIAHLFEHMMFKGAKRYSGKDFDRLMHSNGATNNAFTSRDYTGYYENFPSNKLELMIDLESDRMQNLSITEENLKSEREVVKEERRYRVDNDIYGILSEAVWGSVFKVHPYRWPVIGYMRDLNNITVEKCKEFFRQYYAPNNAVVVVAGSFEPRKAKSLIEKYYSKIPSQKIHWTQVPAEPIQQGQRTVVREKDVRNTTFSLAYQAPKAGEADAYAMDLLASILGEGDSSRLYKRLVYRQQMASEVSAFSYTLKDPGVFQVVVSVRPGLEREGVLSAVFSEIWKLQNRSVELAELEKSKNLILKSYIDSLKTVSGKARALALNEVLFGDYSTFFKDLDLYKKVTADDIQRVANLYLKPSQRSVVVVKPKAEAKTVATKEGA